MSNNLKKALETKKERREEFSNTLKEPFKLMEIQLMNLGTIGFSVYNLSYTRNFLA